MPCGFYLSFFHSSFIFFSSPNLRGRRLDVYHTSTHGVRGPSANLECRSEMCCRRLAANAGPKQSPKIAIWAPSHNCRAISSQLRHVSTIGKKLVKQQYLLHMSSQFGELGPLAAEIGPVLWGTPANFNWYRVLAALLHAM